LPDKERQGDSTGQAASFVRRSSLSPSSDRLDLKFMYSEDDLQYALENTKVIVSPDRRIETFGATSFHFYLVTELMDRANEIRIVPKS
jgi:hypothetical protein